MPGLEIPGSAGPGLPPSIQPRKGRPCTEELVDALAELDRRCSGRLCVSACCLATGEVANWREYERCRTASTAKVAILGVVMQKAQSGELDLSTRLEVGESDRVGGSGILGLLRPGLRPTVDDLCTLMITVSDNTATNILVDLVGGTTAVNRALAGMGFAEISILRRMPYPAPRPVSTRQSLPEPLGPFALANAADMRRLIEAVKTGELVSGQASHYILELLSLQQSHSGVPRAFLELGEPGTPSTRSLSVMSKTGAVPGCRAEVGLILFPDGTEVAYAVIADDLADTTMTALSEGDELLGRTGAALVSHWWASPQAPPLRPGWGVR
jgi:beta-lactamase class A